MSPHEAGLRRRAGARIDGLFNFVRAEATTTSGAPEYRGAGGLRAVAKGTTLHGGASLLG